MIIKSSESIQKAYEVIDKTSESLTLLKDKYMSLRQQTEEYFNIKEEINE